MDTADRHPREPRTGVGAAIMGLIDAEAERKDARTWRGGSADPHAAADHLSSFQKASEQTTIAQADPTSLVQQVLATLPEGKDRKAEPMQALQRALAAYHAAWTGDRRRQPDVDDDDYWKTYSEIITSFVGEVRKTQARAQELGLDGGVLD